MRILFVWTAAEFSVQDVARGYRLALAKQGHEIHDYRLSRRIMYHVRALGEPKCQDMELVAKLASENVIIEAIRHHADLIVIISALHFHPDAIWFLARCSWPTVAIFTESPYFDEKQAMFAGVYPEMLCATQDGFSARRYDWLHLPPSYDPDIHKPVDPDPAEACDVILIGTGWAERVKLLEQVDWTGIKLRLIGLWSHVGSLPHDSPLVPFVEERTLDNRENARFYASAKICLNIHRHGTDAESANPRIYEAAACGAFQLSDHRHDLAKTFGSSIPIFTDAKDLEYQIRFYLANDELRQADARRARELVRGETFDARAATLMDAVARRSTKVAV